MKKTLGVLLVATGIALGLYLGVWVFFVGGILGLVDAVNLLIAGTGLDGMLIVWSILKLMFAGFVGWMSAAVLVLPGLKLLNK